MTAILLGITGGVLIGWAIRGTIADRQTREIRRRLRYESGTAEAQTLENKSLRRRLEHACANFDRVREENNSLQRLLDLSRQPDEVTFGLTPPEPHPHS